ncbi:MAG: hypothetical protein K2F79_00610, partial [Muribaculaceae bacterium]|nr:hypothetical protein [Muribaculaceae bacterium]
MAKNNHSESEHRKRLEKILLSQASDADSKPIHDVFVYAECVSKIENALVVVSDLTKGCSRIFKGKFPPVPWLSDYSTEDSIWERRILSLMPECERMEKFIAELRFLHYLKHCAKDKRKVCCLMSRLRFDLPEKGMTDVLHRMYYI